MISAGMTSETSKVGSISAVDGEAATGEREAENTVLVVNDTLDQLDLMSFLLRKSGYRVLTAFDGCEGFEAAQAELPDMVVADVSMPRMDGIEMCRLIREHPELRRTPVLLVSAIRKNSDSVVEGLKAGADDYMEAPYDPMLLVTKVARLIERKRTEERLHESEERYRVVAETATDVIITIDEKSTILFVNRSVERMFGYSVEEMLGRQITMLMPEYLRHVHKAAVIRYVQTGRKHANWESVEIVGLHKNGREFPLELSFGEFVKNGRHFFTGIARDITERKRAEEAAHHLAAIVESSEDAILRMTLGGLITSWNVGAEKMYGYTEAEAIGNHISLIIPPEHGQEPAKVLEKLKHGERVQHLETERVRKDKTRVDVSISISPVRDATGQVVGASTIARDITERKRAEQELSRSEERYRDLVENARDIIYTHDLEGNYTSINKAGEQIIGYTQEEALRLNRAQIMPPEYLDKAGQMVMRKLAGEEETVYDLEMTAKDGRRIAVEVNSRLVFQDGVAVGVQGIARDVTERKQLEEQLRQSQKMEAIGQLAGGIAHDFNNLLTAITGYSDLTLRRLRAEDPLRRNIEEIRKAGELAASLTRQLLAFSRKQVLQPIVLDLNGVVSDLEKMLQRLIGENIELRTALDPTLGRIKADPGQIEQVIMNLAVNARDAMPHGGRLTIETENVYLDEEYASHHLSVKSGPYVLMAVSDTGTGMDEATLARIFEPFFTTKEVDKGTGLGLSTVYGIIRQSDGNIWVYSEVRQGTAFKIYLPRIAADAPMVKRNTEPEGALEGTETILLAEDDERVRHLVREVLESYGYRVLEAANGGAALLICDHHEGPIHLLITDVIMPAMSGRDLADRLGRQRPETKLLYMSGYTDDAIVHHGVLDADAPFIQKPFAPDILLRKVKEVLGNNR